MVSNDTKCKVLVAARSAPRIVGFDTAAQRSHTQADFLKFGLTIRSRRPHRLALIHFGAPPQNGAQALRQRLIIIVGRRRQPVVIFVASRIGCITLFNIVVTSRRFTVMVSVKLMLRREETILGLMVFRIGFIDTGTAGDVEPGEGEQETDTSTGNGHEERRRTVGNDRFQPRRRNEVRGRALLQKF